VSSLLGIWRQHHAKIPFLLEDADAEPGQFAERKAIVGAAALAHVLDMVV